MNHIIIGTAGHVDHGKTSLIKSLTGIDTDRLEEEKQRGITIELGFASIDLGNGIPTGIIDVPGHEKFIKNMLAGAGGIDIALLVVAADEGFMPQTREHFSILTLLGIKRGVVAITKSDMVDAEWLEVVVDEVREELKGSFLEDCKIITVSAKTGENLGALKEELKTLAETAEDKNTTRPFRLPVDRVFTVDGFGTVVTGTLIEGKVTVGDKGMIYPSGLESKIRNIQVHGADSDFALAGQRVAINLGGIKKEKIQKGDVLTAEGSIKNTTLIDCSLTIVKEFGRVIKNNTRLHFHTGSRNVLCNIILLDKDSLSAGETGYAQLRLEEEVPIKYGDRYVVRFYSPLETVGGGVVLEVNAKKHKRHSEDVIAALKAKEDGDKPARVRLLLEESEAGLAIADVADEIEISAEEAKAILTAGDGICELSKGSYIDTKRIERLVTRGEKLVADFHAENPVASGMDRAKLCSSLGSNVTDEIMALVIAKSSQLELVGGVVKLSSFKVELTDASGKIVVKLRELFAGWGFTPLMLPEMEKEFEKQKPDFKKAIKAMCDGGELDFITQQYLLPVETIAKADEIIRKLYADKGEIILADFRDATATSRKYALPMLEYFDKKGITKRVGENRALK